MNSFEAAAKTHQTRRAQTRLADPILEELWTIKAQINAEGGYDLKAISERAKSFAAPYLDSTGRVRGQPLSLRA